MLLSMLQRRRARIHSYGLGGRRVSRTRHHLFFIWGQPLPLLLPQGARRDRNELVGSRSPHQDGDFVVRRPPPALCHECLNGMVALMAALAELCEQFRRNASDLETGISPPCVTLILDFIAEHSNLTRERIAVDFREIGPAF